MFQLAPTIASRKPVMKDESFTDFSGGWNTSDTDPGLEQRYSTRSENMMLHADGTYGVRWGTQFTGDIANQEPTQGTLASSTFSSVAGSAVISVLHTNHGLLSGHTITFTGATGFGGVPAGDINQEHDITFIDANRYSFVVATIATATAINSGVIIFTHNNKSVGSVIIACRFFQGRYVIVTELGVILEISTSGISRIIFNNLMAGETFGGA